MYQIGPSFLLMGLDKFFLMVVLCLCDKQDQNVTQIKIKIPINIRIITINGSNFRKASRAIVFDIFLYLVFVIQNPDYVIKTLFSMYL